MVFGPLPDIGSLMANPYTAFLIRTLLAITTFLVIYLFTRSWLKRAEARIATNKEPAGVRRAKLTRLMFLKRSIYVVFVGITVLVILAGIPQFRTISYSLLASASIIAIIVGFATQKTLSNVISGAFLVLYEPFRVGDKVKLGDEYGIIEEITLRHTIVQTWDNKRIVTPNAKIDEQDIVNFSLKEEKVMWTVNIGISYDSDIDQAKAIMVKAAKDHPDILLTDGDPFVRVTECGDFAVNLRLYFWCEDAWAAWKMGYDLTESIKKTFDQQSIEIPFPYRTIVFKKDIDNAKRVPSPRFGTRTIKRSKRAKSEGKKTLKRKSSRSTKRTSQRAGR